LSRIHFIGGEKGGVGKSVLSRLLAQYHIDNELPFRVFDSDRSHGAMLRFYAEFSDPVLLDAFDSADRLMETAVAEPGSIIVDLAAQTAVPLFDWIDENDLAGLAADVDVGLCFWHVMDDGADSIDLLSTLLGRIDPHSTLIVVRNLGRGSDFSAFNRSDARAAAVERGARIIDLPALHAPTMGRVDHHNASFWAAANNRDALGLMDRQRVRVWLRRAYQQLDGLAPELLAPTAAPTAPPEIANGTDPESDAANIGC
jgi:hypothetical protein